MPDIYFGQYVNGLPGHTYSARLIVRDQLKVFLYRLELVDQDMIFSRGLSLTMRVYLSNPLIFQISPDSSLCHMQLKSAPVMMHKFIWNGISIID